MARKKKRKTTAWPIDEQKKLSQATAFDLTATLLKAHGFVQSMTFLFEFKNELEKRGWDEAAMGYYRQKQIEKGLGIDTK